MYMLYMHVHYISTNYNVCKTPSPGLSSSQEAIRAWWTYLRISTVCPYGIASTLKSRYWFTSSGLRRSRSIFRHSSQITPQSEVYVQLGHTLCTLLVLRQPLVRVPSRRRRQKIGTVFYQRTSENVPHCWLFAVNSRLFILIKPPIN